MAKHKSSTQRIIEEFRQLTDGERQTMLEVLTAQYGQARPRKQTDKAQARARKPITKSPETDPAGSA